MEWFYKFFWFFSVIIAAVGAIGLSYNAYTHYRPIISHEVYTSYLSGNFSCSLPIQPWFYAPTAEVPQVISFGPRVVNLAREVFRVEVAQNREDALLQHYLFYNTDKIETLASDKTRVLVLMSTQVTDATFSFYNKKVRTSSPVYQFQQDWNFIKYVAENNKRFILKNITYYTDSDIIEEIYNFLPYKNPVPLSSLLRCLPATPPAYLGRCSWFKDGFKFLQGDCVEN